MKRKLLLSVLSSLVILTAQADIICPSGPAKCFKLLHGRISCLLQGNDGFWTLSPKSSLDLSFGNTYILPFSGAATTKASKHTNAMSMCTYVVYNVNYYDAIFVSKVPLQPDTSSTSWSPWAKGFICLATPNLCPFKD